MPLRRHALRYLAFVLAVALLACSTPEERFAEHVARAQTHLQEGQDDDAIIELQSALKIDPGDAAVNQQLAELMKGRGSLQAAAFHYGEAYRLDPSRVDAGVEQATLLWRTAPRRAAQIIAQMKQRYPDDGRVYRGEAALAIARKQFGEAVAAARRAAELEPEEPESWATLGTAYIEKTRAASRKGNAEPSDYDAGIEAFEKLDALTGGHVGARVERARLLAHRGGHDEEAVAGFRSAIELAREQDNDGGVVFAAQRFGAYARRVGSTAHNVEALRAIVEAAPERARDWDALARAMDQLEGPGSGDAVYAEFLEKQPDLPAAHVAYALYLARGGRELDAIAHLDRAIADGIDDPLVWEQLVRLELQQGRIADARASVEEMRNRLGDHDATLRSEARLAIREQQPERALEVLRAFAGEKESAETEILRAVAERSRGNLAAAASAAERAVALSPRGDSAALHIKADIHGEAGDWEAVLATLDQLQRRGRPLTSAERVLEARAQYELGDAERGRALLEEILARKAFPPAAAVEFAEREGREHPEEARQHLANALRLAPGNHPVLEAMTRIDLRAGRTAQALARLDRLVEAQLAGPRVLLLRAEVLIHAGQLDRAEADALRAFEAIPEMFDAVDLLFTIYAAQGKIDEARRSFEEADSVGVLHKGARVLLARLEAAQGEEEKARKLYEQVLAEDDSMTAAQLDLARLLSASGDELDRALELAEKAQRALPDKPEIADTVGYVYYQKGRHEVALQQFRYALELSKQAGVSPPAVHYHLGLALAALGRNPEAASAFQRALEIDPSFQGADDARRQLEAVRSASSGAKG